MTGMRLKSTPSGYPVVGKSWVDGLSPYKVPVEDDPEPRVVRGLAEKVGKDVERGNGFGGQFCEGRLMGFNNQSGRVCIYWPDKRTVTVEHSTYVDKTGVLNSRFEGEERDGFIETKVDEPVKNLTVPASRPWNSDPPASSDAPSSNVQPVLVNDDPDLESADNPTEPEIHPNAERWPAGRAIASNDVEGPEIAQGIELGTLVPQSARLQRQQTSTMPGMQFLRGRSPRTA